MLVFCLVTKTFSPDNYFLSLSRQLESLNEGYPSKIYSFLEASRTMLFYLKFIDNQVRWLYQVCFSEIKSLN